MGLDNRDYVHDESGYDGFGGGHRPSGAAGLSTVAKLTICVGVIYGLAALIPELAYNLTLSWEGLRSFKLWQVLTYAVTPIGRSVEDPGRAAAIEAASRSIISLAFALYVLFVFGRMLTQLVGEKELLWLLGASVLAGGVAAAVLSPAGLVYADVWMMAHVCLVWVALRRPHDQILLFFVLPVPLWVVAALIVGFSLYGALVGAAAAAVPTLAALAVAAVHERRRLRFAGFADSAREWKRQRSRPKLRVHNPDADERSDVDDGFNDRVDAVLAKLSEQGEAALTAKERRLLKQASKRYKNRV